MSFDLSNYVDVKTRIKLFYDKYPQGSLQFEFKGVMPNNPDYIWGVTYAYRTPEDLKPSTGTASELGKGKTSFTAGSELANLESSCHGRAIGAFGLGIDAAMATSDEVQFAKERQREIPRAEQFTEEYKAEPVSQTMRRVGVAEMMTEKQQALILTLVKGMPGRPIDEYKAAKGITGGFTKSDASKFIEHLKDNPTQVDPWAADIARGGSDE
jgi:hypothetical protein